MFEISCLVVYVVYVVYVDLQHILIINPARLKYQLKIAFWSAPWSSRYFRKLHLQELVYVSRTILDARPICTTINFDVLLTLHRSIFISVFNQLDAQNLLHHKFYFMPLHVSSTYAHHQEVKIVLHSLWYDDTRGCVIQF